MRTSSWRKPVEEQDSTDRRTEIRQKARDLFIRYGYRKTTIEDIGKACGLGKAALYHYYSCKEEIFAEVARAEHASMLIQVRAAVHAAGDPKAQFAAFVRTRFRLFKDIVSDAVGGGLGAELEELLPLTATVRHEFFLEEARILEQIIKDGQRQGVFKKLHRSAPHIIIAGMSGLEIRFAEIQDAPSLDEAIEAMVELYLGGICG